MDNRIERELAALIAREGGFVDDPRDAGGPTRWGVTERVARAHGYAGSMATLPRATAEAIYRELYWCKPGFDRVARIAPEVAFELFDTGVNMGPATAVRFLQRALGALNHAVRYGPSPRIDGVIGERVLATLARFLDHRGSRGERTLVRALDCLQGARYIELAERRPANAAFVYGWLDTRLAA